MINLIGHTLAACLQAAFLTEAIFENKVFLKYWSGMFLFYELFLAVYYSLK